MYAIRSYYGLNDPEPGGASMVSIAFFPCTFIDGASIVGEVAARLGLRVYTDALLYLDVV